VIDFAELLVQLTDAVPIGAGGADAGIALDVVSMELELPLETRIVAGGDLEASFPRGRMATGFDPALARLAARFDVKGG
jgi:hypothetical protein